MTTVGFTHGYHRNVATRLGERTIARRDPKLLVPERWRTDDLLNVTFRYVVHS